MDKIVKERRKKYGIIHGIIDMFTGKYIVGCWRKNSDAEDLQGDIILMNANVALVGALISTISIPMFTAVNREEFTTSTCAYVYVFFVATCSVLEAVSVLICIRNLLLISLVDAENMEDFIRIANDVFVVPMRLNFLAVGCMGAALVCYALWQFDYQVTIVYSIIVNVPAIFVTGFYIGRGISDLNAVQGWEKEGEKKGLETALRNERVLQVYPEN